MLGFWLEVVCNYLGVFLFQSPTSSKLDKVWIINWMHIIRVDVPWWCQQSHNNNLQPSDGQEGEERTRGEGVRVMSAGDFVSTGLVQLSMLLSMPRCCYLKINKALFQSNTDTPRAAAQFQAAASTPRRHMQYGRQEKNYSTTSLVVHLKYIPMELHAHKNIQYIYIYKQSITLYAKPSIMNGFYLERSASYQEEMLRLSLWEM